MDARTAHPLALVQQAASDLSGIIRGKCDVLPMDVHAELCLIASYLDDFLKSDLGQA